MIKTRRPNPLACALAVIAGAALALATQGCAKDPLTQLDDEAVRARVIDAVLASPQARQQVIDRMLGTPADLDTILGGVLADEARARDLVNRLVADDRGKALVVAGVTADDAGARTFIRMLMTTGVMGSSITQRQADALGMGEAYAYGNRRRTMSDLKRLGRALDDWGGQHEGRHPACPDLADVRTCLAPGLPAEAIAGLRLDDAWGKPFQYSSDPEGARYMLLSYATDGAWDGMGKVGPTDHLDCDIVFSNGEFIQWPGSIRREEIP